MTSLTMRRPTSDPQYRRLSNNMLSVFPDSACLDIASSLLELSVAVVLGSLAPSCVRGRDLDYNQFASISNICLGKTVPSVA